MKLGAWIAVLSLVTPLPNRAQGTLAEHYDTSKRVSFAGTVDAVIMPPGELPVCFLMTVQNSGKSEHWVVAGDAFPVLRKAGWRFGPTGQVKPGASASASVFLPKPRSTAARTLGTRLRETMPTGISAVADAALKAGRLAQGIEVKLADGQTLPFGPGQGDRPPLRAQQPAPKPTDHMQHRFDDPARFAKSFDDPKRDAWQMPDRVIAALALKPDFSVADIGAGTGIFSMRLAKAVPDGAVYAVDIEPKMVAHLKTRATGEKLTNVTPVLASATSPNLSRPVDLILVVDTYHHIGDRPDYFRALRSRLTPGGRIAIIDFRKDAPEGPPAHFRFTPEQIKKEMAAAGYVVDAEHDFLPRQHFLIFR